LVWPFALASNAVAGIEAVEPTLSFAQCAVGLSSLRCRRQFGAVRRRGQQGQQQALTLHPCRVSRADAGQGCCSAVHASIVSLCRAAS
jgi:hypothetical protein